MTRMKLTIKCLGLLITLLTFEVLGQKTCRDCMLYTSCLRAVQLANGHMHDDDIMKLFYAICGSDEQKIVKVCCSDFDEIDIGFGTNAIENHPNYKLLPNECGEIYGGREVGNQFAAMYEFPWMALISYITHDGLEFGCGGTIINSRYVLTAAHCIVGRNIAGVRLGEYNMLTKVDCTGKDDLLMCEQSLQDLRVEEIISHENFTHYPVTNDIALIRVPNDINFLKKNVGPICLPINSNLRNKVKAENGLLTGWRLMANKSAVLLKVEVPIKNEKTCRDYVNRNPNASKEESASNNVICAGGNDINTCIGDPGGPLQIEELYNGLHRYVQYGIASCGPTQCLSKSPTIYTDVTKYVDWILDHIRM